MGMRSSPSRLIFAGQRAHRRALDPVGEEAEGRPDQGSQRQEGRNREDTSPQAFGAALAGAVCDRTDQIRFG